MTVSQDDARRQEMIERYGVLTGPPGRDLQALVDLAALVCDVPFAAVNLITGSLQRQVATVGLDAVDCAREDSMCAAVLTEPGPVVVPDARRDGRLRGSPFVTGELGSTRFYASAPLVSPAGVIGRICAFDTVPRELSGRQRDALVTLGERLVDVLELRLCRRLLERTLAELTEARDRLQRSNEHLGQFAGQVTHDLRTPLTAIVANAELLAGEPAVEASEDARWMADGILRGAGRMNQMIEHVLDYARLGGSLRIRPTDLAAVVDAVLEDLGPRITEAGAQVKAGALPVVPCDEQQVYAVLMNLVLNAVTFARAGVAPRVEVDATRHRGRWRVSVTDNGVGVPADRREAMFVLFARADKRIEGDGIGLAAARRIVEAHGGHMGMEDGVDGGTTVWFELPA